MSQCRANFHIESENALNEQINMELAASYTYMNYAAHFGRDDVALPGFAKFFKENSDEEREHAQKLIDYQNMRGGRNVFTTIKAPQVNGEITPLNSLTEALSMELQVYNSLLKLHKVAEDNNDAQFTDFIEGNFLSEQVEAQKEIADLITNLKRCGSEGLGLYLFDKQLQERK